MSALKQSNRRLVSGRATGGPAKRAPSALHKGQHASELEGQVTQLEQLAAGCGFGEDNDFSDMCEDLRKLDKRGCMTATQLMSLHALVREGVGCKSLGDRVRLLQRVHTWAAQTQAQVKSKDKTTAKAAKLAKKDADQRRSQAREAQRQRQDRIDEAKITATKQAEERSRKSSMREKEQEANKSKVQQWSREKLVVEEKQQQEQSLLQAEKIKNQKMQRKLVRAKRQAEMARQEAQLEAHQAQQALVQQASSRRSDESRINARVQQEVKRQLAAALKEHMGSLEAEMFDASLKAKAFQKQQLAQISYQECVLEDALEEEAAPVEEEASLREDWAGWDDEAGDWGDSEDEGLPCGHSPAQGSVSDQESELPEELLQVMGPELDAEKAEMLGLAFNPPSLTLKLETLAPPVRPESPMTSRFWDTTSCNADTAVGDRVKAAVERARRMAELAFERRTGRTSCADTQESCPTEHGEQ